MSNSKVPPIRNSPLPRLRRQGRVAIVELRGVIDRGAIEYADQLLRCEGENSAGAVLDLTHASHIDYRGIVLLVARRRVLKARGGELAVAAATSDVRLIVRATAGAEIPVFQTREQAKAYVQGEPDSVATAGARTSRRIEKSRPAGGP